MCENLRKELLGQEKWGKVMGEWGTGSRPTAQTSLSAGSDPKSPYLEGEAWKLGSWSDMYSTQIAGCEECGIRAGGLGRGSQGFTWNTGGTKR